MRHSKTSKSGLSLADLLARENGTAKGKQTKRQKKQAEGLKQYLQQIEETQQQQITEQKQAKTELEEIAENITNDYQEAIILGIPKTQTTPTRDAFYPALQQGHPLTTGDSMRNFHCRPATEAEETKKLVNIAN